MYPTFDRETLTPKQQEHVVEVEELIGKPIEKLCHRDRHSPTESNDGHWQLDKAYESMNSARRRSLGKHTCKATNDAYYGRGIEWKFDGLKLPSFRLFLAEMGLPKTREHSIDRINGGTSNYELGNIKWSTKKEQMDNRTFKRRRNNG